MKWNNDLLDLAERFGHADGFEAAWSILKSGIGRYGASEAGMLFQWSENSNASSDLIMHLDYPQGYLDCFEERGHADHDFSISHCLTEPEQYALSCDEQLLSRLSPEALAAERDAYEFGIRHVIVMPWRGGGGRGGWSANFRGTNRKEFLHLIGAHVDDIQRIGLMFHGAIRPQPGLGGLVALSPREREVLTWTAAGRGAKVIAHRLNLSTRTVEHHIASAAKRLGAHNRTHAVAKALVLNLIQP